MYLYKLLTFDKDDSLYEQELLTHIDKFSPEEFTKMEKESRLRVYAKLSAAEKNLYKNYSNLFGAVIQDMIDEYGFRRAQITAKLEKKFYEPPLNTMERQELGLEGNAAKPYQR